MTMGERLRNAHQWRRDRAGASIAASGSRNGGAELGVTYAAAAPQEVADGQA